jgi:hypothetical protein
VHNPDLLLVDRLGVLESETQDALGGLLSDELDALDNTVDNNVLDTGVFTLGVLTDQDSVDTVVGGLVAGDGATRTDVGEQVESTAQSQVQGDVTLTDGGLGNRDQYGEPMRRDEVGTYSQGTLEGNVILLYAGNGFVRNSGLAVLQNGADIDGLPLDGGL